MNKFEDFTTEQKWDVVYEVIKKVDDEHVPIYVNTYTYNDDETILVFDDTKSSDQFNQMVYEYLTENNIDITEEKDNFQFERGDDDYWLALITEDHWTYSDEGYVCSECDKFFYYDEYGGVGYSNYFVGDGYIICEDCLKENEDYKELFFDNLINNPDNVNSIFTSEELVEEGFERVNSEHYDVGMYGYNRNIMPKDILEKVRKDNPNMDYIFHVVKNYNPFETEFDLYARETEQ